VEHAQHQPGDDVLALEPVITRLMLGVLHRA